MLGRLLIRLIINAAALACADWAIDGITSDGATSLFVVALIFGIVNAFIRPIITILSLPLLILTLGLFTFVINALMLMLSSWIAGIFGIGFAVNGFGAALLGAVIISVVSILLSMLLHSDAPERREAFDRS